MRNQQSDAGLLLAHVKDLCEACRRSGAPRFSAFLDEHACALAMQRMQHVREVSASLWGGYSGAVRNLLCVHPPERPPKPEQYPLTALSLRYRAADTLTHRDVLGAVMALHVTRDSVGDILIESGQAQVFIRKSVAPVLLEELRKIGRVGVAVSESDAILTVPHTFQEIGGTVASLRLDCVVSFAAKISREKAAQLIAAQMVGVNGLPVTSVHTQLSCEQVLSIRGYGKFRLTEQGNLTKKGRLHITLQKYC